MALHILYSYTRDNTPNPSTLIEVYWNDVSSDFFVNEDGSAIFSGPADGTAGQIIGYYFCTGTTLTRFLGKAAYPYAEKFEDLDSPSCAVAPDNLIITVPVTVTPASEPSASDGTATVYYTGTVSSPSNVYFSLDNSTWQSSNVFTGLPPGSYTVYVRDQDPSLTSAEWHRDDANFVITAGAVVYGKRYTLAFDSVDGVDYTLDVYKKNYEGTVTDVIGGASPAIIEYSDNGNDKYESIKGSKCSIELQSETNFQFLDFFSSDEREHRIDLLKEGVLFWRGFILPDIYNEPFIAPKYFVSLTASDGLGTLKGYPYADANNNAFIGERSFIDIIFDCLDKLECSLPVMSIVDVYEAGMREATATTDTDPIISDPLYQAKVNTANFKDEKGVLMDCEKVLEYCLEAFGARIYQSGGKWIIESIDAKRGELWAVNYNADRTFSSYQIIDPVIDTAIPNTGGLQWIGADQQLEIIPAYKKTVVQSDLVKAETNIPDGHFKNSAWNGTTLRLFNATADIEKVVVSDKDGTNAVKLINGVTSIGTAKYLQSIPFNLVADATEKLHLSIKYKIGKNGVDSLTPEIYFQLTGGGYTFTNNVWVPSTASTYFVFESDQLNNIATFEFVIPTIPVTADYSFTIYEVVNANSLELHSLDLGILPGGVSPKGFTDSTVTNPRAYSFIPDPKEVYFTDTQQTTNFKRTHRNYIDIDGAQSSSWHFKGEAGDNSLLNILASNIAYNYSRPTHVLRGTLKGDMSYFNTIREEYDQWRVFMPNGLSIDPKRGTYSGTFYELITELTGDPSKYVMDGYVLEDYV
jgi:hypothetical protein